MNEIWTTVVGNIASGITRRRTFDGHELASFRVASNRRKFDSASGDWQDGAPSFVTVTAWRQLGQNVAASFVKGDPVIVYGRLSAREYVAKDGTPRTDVGIEAKAVGADLSRCTTVLSKTSSRTSAAAPGADAVAGVPAQDARYGGDRRVAAEPADEDEIFEAPDPDDELDGADDSGPALRPAELTLASSS